MTLDTTDVAAQAEMVATVYKTLVNVGDVVQPGQIIVILEVVKMEVAIKANIGEARQVRAVLVQPGVVVQPGEKLVVLCPIKGSGAEYTS